MLLPARAACLRTARLFVVLLLLTPLWLQAAAAADTAEEPSPGWQPGPEQPLDLARYMGRWYVVARVPHPVERGHVASTLDYTLEGSERVAIRYRYRERLDGGQRVLSLRARTDADDGHRRWRSWYYRVIPNRTLVLEVADDYRWALVGQRGGDMAWILAREPDMSQAQYHALSERLADHGYNTDRMRRVVHLPDQVGRLGFETPPQQ